MQTMTTIGLDIAKSVFQVHGVDAAGAVVIRRQLKRRSVLAFFQKLPPCLVSIEACASSRPANLDQGSLRKVAYLNHQIRRRLLNHRLSTAPRSRRRASLNGRGILAAEPFARGILQTHRCSDSTRKPPAACSGRNRTWEEL